VTSLTFVSSYGKETYSCSVRRRAGIAVPCLNLASVGWMSRRELAERTADIALVATARRCNFVLMLDVKLGDSGSL